MRPHGPLSPMLTSGDRLVIADVENRHWVTVDEGRSTTEPMPADLVAWDRSRAPVTSSMSPRSPCHQRAGRLRGARL